MASVDPVKGAGENHGQVSVLGTEAGLLSPPQGHYDGSQGTQPGGATGQEKSCSSCPGEQRKGQRGPGRAGSRSVSWGCCTPGLPRGRAQELILAGLWQPEACGGGVSRPTLDPKALREDPPAAPGAASPQSQLRLHKAFSPVCLSSSVQQGHQLLDLGPTRIIQGDLILRSETWLHPQRPFFQISSHL